MIVHTHENFWCVKLLLKPSYLFGRQTGKVLTAGWSAAQEESSTDNIVQVSMIMGDF